MKLVETEYTDRNGTKRTRRERLFRFPDFGITIGSIIML